MPYHIIYIINSLYPRVSWRIQGQIQDFKLGGALKKIAPSGGRLENFGVFRVKNHDFTQKKIIFFSNFRGARAGCAPHPPWIRPWNIYSTYL
jgi:hypothetical protein